MKRLIASRNKIAGWIQINRDKTMSIPNYGRGDDSKKTWFQEGILSLDSLDNAVGFNGEDRQWKTYEDGTKDFGNYREERWEKFLEDIKINGVQNPIMLEVYSDGTIKIVEGNHRVAACRQLGINQIPAEVIYRGGSEDNFKI